MMYVVCHNNDEDALAKDVEAYLEDGWLLQGGISICQFDVDIVFAQAMTLQTEKRLK